MLKKPKMLLPIAQKFYQNTAEFDWTVNSTKEMGFIFSSLLVNLIILQS